MVLTELPDVFACCNTASSVSASHSVCQIKAWMKYPIRPEFYIKMVLFINQFLMFDDLDLLLSYLGLDNSFTKEFLKNYFKDFATLIMLKKSNLGFQDYYYGMYQQGLVWRVAVFNKSWDKCDNYSKIFNKYILEFLTCHWRLEWCVK